MALDRFGNILVVGTLRYYQLIGLAAFSPIGLLDSDAFLLQCDSFGTLGSVRQLGGINGDSGLTIARGLNDVFYFGGGLSGDVFYGAGASPGGTTADSFVAQLGPVTNLYPPRLNATRRGSQLNLNWLARSTNWTLETASSIDGTYANGSMNISRAGRTNIVEFAIPGAGQQYLRLRRMP